MACCNSILVAKHLQPISTRIRTILISSQDISRDKCSPIMRSLTIIDVGHILNIHILLGSKLLRNTCHILPANATIITGCNLTGLTLLSSNQDNTISSTSTINSTRSGILQDINTLDISRIDRVNVTNNAINYIKRSRITIGTSTTDIYIKALTWLTRCGNDIHTRTLVLQS